MSSHPTQMRTLVRSIFATITLAPMAAASMLYTVGLDANFVPQQLAAIDTAVPSLQPEFTLGDGAASFTGGLAYTGVSNGFFVISQDSLGNSVLSQFTIAGGPPAAPLLTLGIGFTGGLAWDSTVGLLYAVGNDSFGASSLYSINLLGGTTTNLFSLGSGFTGGLAFDPATDHFYAISNDSLGNSTLNSVALDGTVTALALSVGQGYTGGLAYDLSGDLFYAINSDSQGNSSLVDFSLASVSPAVVGGLGQGFNNAALTVGPAAGGPPPSVPEPAVIWLIGGGLLAIAGIRKYRDGKRR